MATVNPTVKADTYQNIPKGCALVQWANLLNGDSGLGVKICNFADKTVDFSNTFGTGGTVIMEGSSNSTNGINGTWFQMRDSTHTLISKTSADGETLLENPLYVRPRVTAGDGSTAINVDMLAATPRQA